MRCLFLLSTILFLNVFELFSQSADQGPVISKDLALNVYLDCKYCDLEYIKSNFTIVNYVTERKLADVMVQVTTMDNASGGLEYTLLLFGQGRYKNLRDTVSFNIPGDISQEAQRYAVLDNLRLGLVPYLLKTPYREKLTLYIEEEYDRTEGKEVSDPWRSWMFRISGSGSLFSQKSDKSYGFNASLYIGKITPEVKFESMNRAEYNDSRFSLYEADSLVYSLYLVKRNYESSNLFVRSLGNHAGIGGIATFRKSDYSNIDFQMITGPAVEFNIYSYEDASRKQFRFIYAALYEHTNYIDSTIHSKLNDYLFTHELHVKFMHISSWGTINATAIGSSYLNNPNQYSIGAYASADVFLFKGLSFGISCGFTYQHDQIGLRKSAADVEDILTDQREMQTDYSYNVIFSINYRFGSIFNNTVNPRFGD